MFRITHNIQSGNYRFPQVNGIVVERSMENLTSTCTITLPRNVKYQGNEVSKLIKKGDPVIVEAGYDDQNNLLFSGYVRQIVTGTPLRIECEDEMYRLKQITVSTEHFPSLQLSALLSKYLPADISNQTQDVSLGEFRISNNPNLAKVLDYIKENYGLRFFFKDKTLYGVLPSAALSQQGKTVNLDFKQNIKEDRITYLEDDEVKIIVKVKTVLPNNQKLEVQEPEKATDGQVHTFLALDKKTEKELRDYAKNLLVTFKPGNLTGNVKTWGEPFVEPGDFVKLIDADNSERNNKLCQVQKVVYSLMQPHLTQEIIIGRN